MTNDLTRRHFLGLMGAGSLWPLVRHFPVGASDPAFRIRTVTAGIRLENMGYVEKVEQAADFLAGARQRFVDRGYEVQTLRIATQSLPQYMPDWDSDAALETIRALDDIAVERDLMFNVGPIVTDDRYDERFGPWAAEIIRQTKNVSFTVFVASREHGIHYDSIRTAAEVIAAIAGATPDGEGNFRFAATAYCPPGTPFFPAAYHEGSDAFSIGLESPGLLQAAFEAESDIRMAKDRLWNDMNAALKPVEQLGQTLAADGTRRYLGIDVSPAPGLDASIGQAIEALTGRPFGSPSTLAACAAITDVLKTLDVETCGYSGLMLPVLEDPVLARRAAEGRYGTGDLLLYSSVCGTGLDVVPLPGDVSVDALAAAIHDVAALSHKYRKPLSARLFPVPGKAAGDPVHFDNPFLTDSAVMALE